MYSEFSLQALEKACVLLVFPQFLTSSCLKKTLALCSFDSKNEDQVNLANYSLLNVIVTSQSLILTVYM